MQLTDWERPLTLLARLLLSPLQPPAPVEVHVHLELSLSAEPDLVKLLDNLLHHKIAEAVQLGQPAPPGLRLVPPETGVENLTSLARVYLS